jgi:hypothetical protein
MQRYLQSLVPPLIPDPDPGEPIGLFFRGTEFIWDRGKIEALLTECGIPFNKVVTPNHLNAYIYLDNVADLRAASDYMSRNLVGGRRVYPILLRMELLEIANEGVPLMKRPMATIPTCSMTFCIAPWAGRPYEDQLLEKQTTYHELLRPIIPAARHSPRAQDRALPKPHRPVRRL